MFGTPASNGVAQKPGVLSNTLGSVYNWVGNQAKNAYNSITGSGGSGNTGISYNPDGSVNTSGSDVVTGYTQDSLGNIYLNGQLQQNINPNAGYTVDSSGQVIDQGGNVIQDPSVITSD